MIVEAELKAYTDDLEAVRTRLLSRGALHITDQIEVDEYFAHPARDFGDTDEALRLREIRSAGEDDRKDPMYELSYKGPKLGEEGKSREEYTIAIDNRGSGERILKKLGFTSVRTVSKRRSLYKLNENTITLDDVVDLGTFVEIERMIDSKEQVGKNLSEMKIILTEIFGLSKFERRSYLELLLEKDKIKYK